VARLVAIAWLALFALAGVCGAGSALARSSLPTHAPTIATIAVDELPPQARATLQLIERGGPFPYPHKDGSVFGNFERRLPLAARGYYREYTVPTPGRPDRGARRIVAGGHSGTGFAEYYYTADHYRTWQRIRDR